MARAFAPDLAISGRWSVVSPQMCRAALVLAECIALISVCRYGREYSSNISGEMRSPEAEGSPGWMRSASSMNPAASSALYASASYSETNYRSFFTSSGSMAMDSMSCSVPMMCPALVSGPQLVTADTGVSFPASALAS